MEFDEISVLLDRDSFPPCAKMKGEIEQFSSVFSDDNFKLRFLPNFSTFKQFIDTLKTEFESSGISNINSPAFRELIYALNQITEIRSWAQFGMNQQFNYLLSGDFLGSDTNISTFLYFVAYCYKELNYSKQFLDWCALTILHSQWTGIPSLRNYTADKCFSAYQKKKIALKSQRSFLVIDRFANLKIFTHSGKVKTVEKNHYSIKKDQIFVGEKVYQLNKAIVGDGQCLNRIKTGFIGSFYFDKKDFSKQVFPRELLDSFCDSLTCPDFYLIRSIIAVEVVQTSIDYNEFASDLIAIFSMAKKMNAFLRAMTYINFMTYEDGEQTILRSNSLLSAICTYFSTNYGDWYFERVIKDIVVKIDETGVINYKTPNKEETTKIYDLLCLSVDAVASSFKYIPVQVKHLAFILLSASNAKFSSKRTAYNIIIAFIFLRFVSKILVDTERYQNILHLANNPMKTVIPYAQLLQKIFSLTIPANLKLNDSQLEVMKTKFKSLVDFAFQFSSNEPKAVLYPQVQTDEYYESANRIMRIFASNYDKVLKEYYRLTSDRSLTEPTSIFMSEVIQHCFDEQ